MSWRTALLLALPASGLAAWLHAAPLLTFGLACLAVLPLAGWMGEATEHLAAHTGPATGGFLNATFGNAAELIIAIAALQQGYVDLVKASVTGSILGNLLLILGLSLFAGGLKRETLTFNRTAASMAAGMLALAVVGLVFPSLFHHLHPVGSEGTELLLAEGVALILLATYAASLLFTLKTHRRLLGGEPHPLDSAPWPARRAVGILAAATVGVAIASELLVHAVEGVTASLGWSETFLGLVIIPFIGNAAEHATAVVVARKGKTDLALQIALGSSTQVALLVAPVLVFVGVFLGVPMNLAFAPFEVMAIAVATIVVALAVQDGESNWFEGVQLVALYLMVAVAAFFL